MARVLVGDPYPEIRDLLARVVSGLGLEPVFASGGGDGLPEVDAAILEPADRSQLDLVQALAQRRPGFPVICVSIYPPTDEVMALSPIAYLLKPFSLAALQESIHAAIGRARLIPQAPARA